MSSIPDDPSGLFGFQPDALADIRNIAAAYRQFFVMLTDEGFSDSQALTLTVEFFRRIPLAK